MKDLPLWNIPVGVAEVPEQGMEVVRSADAPIREAVARAAGVIALPRLDAHFRLTRQGHDGVRVIGAVTASVQQTCVVTLEPVTNEVAETIDLIFDPSAADKPLAGEDDPTEAAAGDPAEPLVNGSVNLGALAVEFLLLGIDPYPRKAGAVFASPASPQGNGSAFAALGALKKNRPGKT